MKLIDLNLLFYAADEKAIRGPETVALPWAVLFGFLRLTTRRAMFADPLTVDEAFDVVDGWWALPSVTVVQETSRHLSAEHGAELFSCDADFSRSPGLRWTDPLR